MLNNLKSTHAWNEALSFMLCEQKWSDSQCIDLMKLLMSARKLIPTIGCNFNGDTVLHLSAKLNRPDVAQFLLLESSFRNDPNIRNKKRETPLEQASNPEVINCLISCENTIVDNMKIVS